MSEHDTDLGNGYWTRGRIEPRDPDELPELEVDEEDLESLEPFLE